MNAIYIFFFLFLDVIIYLYLHKIIFMDKKTISILVIVFAAIVMLHIQTLGSNWLSFKQFMLLTQFLISLIIFHYVGQWYMIKIQLSTIFPPQSIQLQKKLIRVVFMNAIYLLVFFLQCVFIINRVR